MNLQRRLRTTIAACLSASIMFACGCSQIGRSTRSADPVKTSPPQIGGVSNPDPSPGLSAADATGSDDAAAADADVHLTAYEDTGDQDVDVRSPSDLAIADVEVIPGTNVQYRLEDIQQIAVANNPAVAAAAAIINKGSGLRRQVGVRPNPLFGYFGQQLANEGTDQNGLFLEQEYVRGGKLRLNQEVLRHTVTAQQYELQTQQYRVLTDVTVLFFRAAAVQQRLRAIEEFSELARRGVQVAKDRRAAQEGTLIEVLQSETLLSEVTLAAQQAKIEYQAAWKNLAAVAGLDDVDSQAAPPQLIASLDATNLQPDWELAYQSILQQSPELMTARALVCEKQALIRRQQVQMTPNVTGQMGAGYDNGTNSGMINLQVSAPIPVYNKNLGNIAAANAEYLRAVRNVQRIEQSIQARLAQAAGDYQSAAAAVSKYQQEIIPQAAQSLELSEQAYRAGELDFLQVLVVRQTYYESTVRLINAQGDLAQAAARIDGLLLTGGLDAPTDYTDGDGLRDQSLGGQ